MSPFFENKPNLRTNKIGIRTLRVNPLRITSAALFLLAPFLSWITVEAFGLTAESSLLDVAMSRTPLAIPPALPVAALFSMVLLLLGALILARTPLLGLPVASAGLAVFWFESSALYGSPPSALRIIVAPGIGMLAALLAIGVGAVSFQLKSQNLSVLLQNISRKDPLAGIGLSVAGFSLVLDGLNHAGLGQLSGFLGTGAVEPIFHQGFLATVFLLAFLFSVRNQFKSPIMDSVLVIAAFAFVLLDAAYHITTGTIDEFVGHDAAETILHISAYYGTALVLIARIKS